MATPDSKDVSDMSGTWVLNRALSDDVDQIFAFQGVSWITRKILSMGTITLQMQQSTETPSAVAKIVQTQVVNPGGFSSEETYVLDGVAHDINGPVFGPLTSCVRYRMVEDLDDADLKGRLAAGGVEKVIEETTTSKNNGWCSVLTWAFENVDGLRRFTQRNLMTGEDGTKLTSRVVYDWKVEG